MRAWKPRTWNTNNPEPTASNTVQVNDQEENNFENFQTHLNVAFEIQECNDSWQSKYSN